MLKHIFAFLTLAALVSGDCYMHNPRGSNNRFRRNDNNNQVQNANRLFNSQNNNKGGYDIGPTDANNRDMMKYYEGSKLLIEWTNQHECSPNSANGLAKTHCDVILQYMCSETLRDGQNTDTIDNQEGADLDFSSGMHEPYLYYDACETRERNRGLFLADRDIVDPLGDDAEFTRQNNNRNRRGFECQEERDYYPYWHPTPWVDIAILTSAPERCDYYLANSENTVSRYECVRPNHQHNNEEDCPSESWRAGDHAGVAGRGHNVAAPECREAIWSRDNHLGNDLTGYMASYWWTLPAAPTQVGTRPPACALRIRYNISTSDYDGWNTDASQNGPNSPVMQDPYVEYGWPGQYLSLALNTNQYGRTFQDRSHAFRIIPRTQDITCQEIYNVNVRGKRGSIQQVYPAVQYDFVPNHLEIEVGDCVHFQWTGSDSNSNNLQGEGTLGTDRSNICEIANPLENFCRPLSEQTMFPDLNTAMRFLHLDQSGCQSLTSLLTEHSGNIQQLERDAQNCMKLNAASPYFDGGLIPFNTEGTFWYMSTRNNNIGWQSQKASITVGPNQK